MLGSSLVLLIALYGLGWSAELETAAGAFLAFTCGLFIWGWHTMSYFMGVITGPRRPRCQPGCRGWSHFFHAVRSGLYHDLAIIITVILMVAMTWGKPNLFGLWTFLVLWTMHVSAKLNVFLGIRNLNKEFIPEHMDYLKAFFRRRSMNLLFPISVTAATIVTWLLIQQATVPGQSAHTVSGLTMLATLMALAVLEHWFMMLPIPAEELWRWSLRNRASSDGAVAASENHLACDREKGADTPEYGYRSGEVDRDPHRRDSETSPRSRQVKATG